MCHRTVDQAYADFNETIQKIPLKERELNNKYLADIIEVEEDENPE